MPSIPREPARSVRRSGMSVLVGTSVLGIVVLSAAACGTTNESLVALTAPATVTSTTVTSTGVTSTSIDASLGTSTAAPSSATGGATTLADSKRRPQLSLESVTYPTKTDPVLTATAQMPTLTGFATAAADAAATAAARKIVTDFTDGFIEQFDGPDALEISPDGPTPTLELTTSLATTLDRFVSLRYDVYADYGGAHPVSYVQSITFDATTGKQLKLTDLAKAQKGAVSRIANAAVDSIIEQMPDLKDFTTVDLTTPADTDWNAWFPERSGVHIVFSQGEAGPSAAGVIDVFIPWDTVTGVAGATGPQ